jgi:hypothetical protein
MRHNWNRGALDFIGEYDWWTGPVLLIIIAKDLLTRLMMLLSDTAHSLPVLVLFITEDLLSRLAVLLLGALRAVVRVAATLRGKI